jgi:hypothetical protein
LILITPSPTSLRNAQGIFGPPEIVRRLVVAGE